jgi:hypothetical protein
MATAKLRNRQDNAPEPVRAAQQRELDALVVPLPVREPMFTRDQLLDLLDFTATKHLTSL